MPATLSPDTSAAPEVVSVSRDQLERLQAELKFAQTRIAALNFEIARLKRWRFGSSSESLDTQAPLFHGILADAALEEQAARDEQQGRGAKTDDQDEKKRSIRTCCAWSPSREATRARRRTGCWRATMA